MHRRTPRIFTLSGLLPVLCLLVLVAGCARDYSYASAPMAEAYAGGMADESRDASYEDYAPEEELDMVMTESISTASRGRSGRNRMMNRSKGRMAPSAPPAVTQSGEKADSGGERAEPKAEPLEAETPQEEPAPSARKRQVIYTATMQVSVYDLPAALAFAESVPERHGGWLQQRQDSQFVLRVPAERLAQIMDEFAELGVVELRTLEGLDVTDQYTDLDSRIRVLEQMQLHLEALLAKAKTVEQALEIRQALDGVTLELEAARAQMRSLAQSIAFSTLVLRFNERGPAQDLPSTNDPFPWVDRLGAESTEFR